MAATFFRRLDPGTVLRGSPRPAHYIFAFVFFVRLIALIAKNAGTISQIVRHTVGNCYPAVAGRPTVEP